MSDAKNRNADPAFREVRMDVEPIPIHDFGASSLQHPAPFPRADGPLNLRSLQESMRLIGTRRFGIFCFASLLSNLGTWAQQIAEPWLLLSLGASSLLIGLDSFAAAAPVWMLTLIGGLLADRGDRRWIITVCQSVQMLCPVLLVVLLYIGNVEPWMVIVLSAAVGITDALSMPSFQSIVPSIVEHEQINTALALNATQFNLSRIVGPALAGILMASVGAIACFAANALSYLPFIWVALWILPRGKPSQTAATAPVGRRFLANLREIVGTPNLRHALLTVLLTSSLCAPLMVYCPVLVKNVLQGDAGQFSLAVGLFGAGGLTGAVILLGVDPNRDRGRISSTFAIAYGAIVILAALSPQFWILAPFLLLAGVAMTISNTSANSVLQNSALPALRGETVSLFMLAIRGGISVGGLLTGLSVHLLGVREALIVNGSLAIVAQAVVARLWMRKASVT